MQYFALLISKERDRTPDEGAAEMAAYQSFHAKAASAIRAGDALLPRRPRCASPAARMRRPSPTARSPRPPKSRAATTYSKPKTSTRLWLWPATSRPPSTAPWRSGRWPTLGSSPAAARQRLARAAAGAADSRAHAGHAGVGGDGGPARGFRALRRASTSSAAPPCTSRRPRQPCGCAMARSCH